MIVLKLLGNKELSIYKLDDLYAKENLIDSIYVILPEKLKSQGFAFTLNILTENTDLGDIWEIDENDVYKVPKELLTEPQKISLWVEFRKGDIIGKSSFIELKVKEVKDIEKIYDKSQVTMFEKVLTNALALNQQTANLKEELKDITLLGQKILDLEKFYNELQQHQILVLQ